jgi:hypothetical protein
MPSNPTGVWRAIARAVQLHAEKQRIVRGPFRARHRLEAMAHLANLRALHRPFLAFGIFLESLAPWQFFRILPAVLTNGNVDGEDILGKGMRDLWLRLGEADRLASAHPSHKCARPFVTELQLAPKFVRGYAELLTEGQRQMRLRRESAGCCDVGQAESRLREKLPRAQYAPFEHITVCGHPGCDAKQAREVSAAVAALPGQYLKTEVTFEISFDQLLHTCELPWRKHR